MFDQREAFPAGPEVTTWQGPGNPAPVSGSCWAQVLASPWTPAQRQPEAGRFHGVGGRGGADAEASGTQGCEGPSGGRASGAAPLTSRAAGPATGCTGCTGCRGSASMGSGCSATDCKTERAVTPRRPGVTPASSRGPHRGARASVLTRASAPGSAISPCGTSWRHRANRRPVAPGASKRAGTTD